MRWSLALACLLLTPALAGCIGLGGEEGDGSGLETQSQAQVSADTGGIEGVVTDEAVQPIQGATVEIPTTGDETSTLEDGSFAFSNLPPGTYTLEITAEGFLGTQKQIDVTSGGIATMEVVLAHQPSVEPFSQQFELKGFLECSAAVPDTVVDTIAPLPGPAYGAVAVCAIPNLLLGGNATNDRFLFTKHIEANPWQMVSELTWDPSNPLTQEMSLAVEADGFPNNNSATFTEASGSAPMILTADREVIAGVVGNLTEACEAGDSDACNRNYIEDGGPLQMRTFVDATDLEPGIAVQQDYTLYLSVFYNTPACDGYSIVEDNRCSQQDTAPEEDPYEDGASSGNQT